MPDPFTEDAGARRQALNPGQSFIVQAPAGSGKTELIVQRYLKLMTYVHAPEEIVAITFTRKAAAEMRHRIMEAVARARAEPPPEAEPLKTTWELAQAVLRHDQDRGWELESHPTRLRIQTIDSLCASLTRQMPLLSRFGSQPGITERADALYRQAARATLSEVESDAKWSDSVADLLRHLDNNWGKIESLLAAMLARRDQWLRHLTDDQRLRRAHLEGALQAAIAAELERAEACCPADIKREWLALARFAAGNMAADSDSPLTACRNLRVFPGTSVEALPQWLGLAHLLLTGKGAWRKKVTKAEGFPAPGTARSPEEKARFKAQKEAMRRFLAGLHENEALRCALQDLRALPPAHYTGAQWAIITVLARFLPLAVAQLRLVFQEQNAVDFTEVAQGALLALGEAGAPTDLALALDYRIRHLLVDEFQDTSLSQFILLERLTAGWEPHDGRTLFVVGDPMQSIYRFREAEVGLYLQAWERGVGSLQLTPLRLSVNFRSQQGIVDWANDSFRRVFPAVESIASGAVTYSPSHASHPPLAGGKAVQVYPFLEPDRAGEAETVVRLVQEARQADPASSVAVLVRSRGHLAGIVPRLREAKLRFQAIDIEPLGSRPAVRDLLALTKALFHVADRLSWLTILRAPWCGLTLSDLHVLAGEVESATLWDRINDSACLDALSETGRQRLTRLRQVLGRALAGRRRASPRRWVEGVWLALGGPACLAEPAALEEAGVYLELLEEHTVANELMDFGALDEAVANLYAPPDSAADETLQIMTIHRAKGLEFDTVIVPGLGYPPRPESHSLLLWAERPAAEQWDGRDSRLLLAPIAGTGEKPDAIYRYIRRLHEEKSRLESDRLLYVAATRARNRLHLLGQVKVDEAGGPKAPQKHSLLACLWPAVGAEFEAAAAAWSETPAPEASQTIEDPPITGSLSRLMAGWECPDPAPGVAIRAPSLPEAVSASPVVEFDWAGEIARHIGSVVHRYLQMMAQEGTGRWNDARIDSLAPALAHALQGKGVAVEALDESVQRAQEALSRTLADERGRWILASRHQDARNEYPLSGILKGRIVRAVIDRTFVDETGVRWIVDYKTGIHEGGGLEVFLDSEQARYRPQLESYAALMALKEPAGRPIRLGLYYPQFSGWREWCWMR